MKIETSFYLEPPFFQLQMYLTKWAVFEHAHGRIPYDLKETMDRLAHFRDRGDINSDAASHNIEEIMRIRAGEVTPMTAVFYDTTLALRRIRRQANSDFWSQHGVTLGTDDWRQIREEEDAANAMLAIQAQADAVQAQEDAHLLWNLADMEAATTVSLTQDEIDELMNEPLIDNIEVDSEEYRIIMNLDE